MSQLHGPVFLHIPFFNVTPLLKGKEEVFWTLKNHRCTIFHPERTNISQPWIP